jgi:hypothetical protein
VGIAWITIFEFVNGTRGFKVTHNTLDHLLREGLSNKIIAEIALLQNKIFTNRDEFLDALPKPMTAIEQEILLR